MVPTPTIPRSSSDAALDGMLGEIPQDDDVALLCVRVAPRAGPFERTIPANPQVLAELRRDLGGWLVLAGVPASDRDEIVLACNEACANAVEHASIAAPRRSIRIAARRSDGAIVVEVADDGAWRDGGAGPERGRGLAIMRAVMDEVEVAPSSSGTVVRMRRRSHRGAGRRRRNVGNERPYTPGTLRCPDRAGMGDLLERRSEIDLTMQLRRVGGWTVVSVEGELDLYSAPQLREAVTAAVQDGADHIVLDLTGVPFMDSSGLGVVVACLKHLRETGGELSVVTPPSSPPDEAAVAHRASIAPIPTHATVDEATA